MTTIVRGRIVKANEFSGTPISLPTVAPVATVSRRVPREMVDAHIEKSRILAAAVSEAAQIMEVARQAARAEREQLSAAVRTEEEARFSAAYLLLRRREELVREDEIPRVTELAKILAERVLRHAVQVDGSLMTSLAKAALLEARGAKRVVIEVHSLDRAHLESSTSELGFPPGSLTLETNDALARGDMRLCTELGSLDARLAPQLERLRKALADALRP